ncbi:MAG: transcriptional repressor [Clostridiaceae bacterium]|mgnify:FL=1|nr:transcriptional repressor [Bacillota bacterium]NLI37873.1 transcriptional repressor [Clostridiaceae bacterium]
MGVKNRYSKMLKRENLRNTSHRQSILEVMEASKEPVSAETLYLTLRDKGISISMSTVYRALDVLVERNIIAKTDFTDNNRSLFEIKREEHRHHLVCVKCKKIIPVTECPFHEYASALEERFGFSITSHKLEMFGYCRKCNKDSDEK